MTFDSMPIFGTLLNSIKLCLLLLLQMHPPRTFLPRASGNYVIVHRSYDFNFDPRLCGILHLEKQRFSCLCTPAKSTHDLP